MPGNLAPTYCCDCRHVYVVHKTDPWYRWLCMKAPRPREINYVAGPGIVNEPYYRCETRNFGECPDFEAGPNEFHHKEMPL